MRDTSRPNVYAQIRLTRMPVLRFPNPGSDLAKMVGTFRLIYEAAQAHDDFDLDFAVRVLIERYQVSSSGAVGEEALRRSTRGDRSRDPLYNQLKMYSELWRMLGWIRPSSSQLRFRATALAAYVCESGYLTPESRRLVQESLLSITFPNPNTENRGLVNLQPFPALLRMMHRMDGMISRDEMIIGLYQLLDDQQPGAFEANVAKLRRIRGDFASLQQQLEATAGGLQVNTLQNYTRFPIGALQSSIVQWAVSERLREPYGRPVVFLRLTEVGASVVADLDRRVDVREQRLRSFSDDVRARFAIIAFYSMIERCGFDISPMAAQVELLERSCGDLYAQLGITSRARIHYSPLQQADRSIVALSDEINIG
jgi:hypothetical protein